jgi:hypothetical protein
MTEDPNPFRFRGHGYRWWFRDTGIWGPWASEYSFNAGRTWHRHLDKAFRTAEEAGELQIAE